mgnify:CR=1 FL=1
MCLNLYIGSSNKLPIITWNDNDPQFYIYEIENKDEISIASDIMQLNYLYKLGSHMGCACGFSFYESEKEIEILNSKRDVMLLLKYLNNNFKDNEIKIVNIDYNTLPDDYSKIYEKNYEINIDVSEILEFSFEENVILKIIK